MNWHRLALLFFFSAGCHSSGGPSLPSVHQLFATDDATLAAEHAPEYFSAAETAREEAERADSVGDRDAAADYATEARLWLAAAITKAHREVRAAQNRRSTEDALAITRSIEEIEGRALRAENESRRLRANRFAESQAQAAYDQAEIDEARRYRSASDLRDTRNLGLASAWAVRTRRVLDTADTLARGPVSTELRARLITALRDRAAVNARDTLDGLWFAAISLLKAEARERQATGSAERLLQGLRGLDTPASRDVRGVSWALPDLFSSASATLNHARWARFLTFCHEHVDGDLVVELSGDASLTRARRDALTGAMDESQARSLLIQERTGPASVRATFPTR